VFNFVPMDSYFTIASLQEQGFTPKLDSLPLGEDFNASLLSENLEFFQNMKVAGKKVFCKGGAVRVQ
jgi:hypothetical protein